jgi:RNA polymerase sigma factor (sigma-70 family)
VSGFQTTQWSIVIAAADSTETAATRDALQLLCKAYWSPLYTYIRRRGYRVEQSEDLTQAFFTKLLEEKGTFRRADPGRGKFRTYLLGTLRHFLSDQTDKVRAAKRGGSQLIVRLDVDAAEGRLAVEDARSPEWHFDREWALTVLRVSLAELEAEYTSRGKGLLFELLRPLLSGGRLHIAHRELAERLGMSEGALKVALHRLRGRYGDCIRGEIARTLGSAGEVEEEIRHLFDVLRS